MIYIQLTDIIVIKKLFNKKFKKLQIYKIIKIKMKIKF